MHVCSLTSPDIMFRTYPLLQKYQELVYNHALKYVVESCSVNHKPAVTHSLTSLASECIVVFVLLLTRLLNNCFAWRHWAGLLGKRKCLHALLC